MTDSWRPAAERLSADLRTLFDTRLRALVAYGPRLEGHADAPMTAMALVDTLTVDDLQACAQLASRWSHEHIATPLLLPYDEFRRSLDAFPLEYAEMQRAHAVVYGGDPFEELTIDTADLRRACETQVKSHLLHLREAYIESGARPGDIAMLVSASAPGFAALLRNVARLTGVHSFNRMEATHAGARAAGIPDGLVSDVLAMEQPGSLPQTDAARLFPVYLNAVERLARFVDTWAQ